MLAFHSSDCWNLQGHQTSHWKKHNTAWAVGMSFLLSRVNILWGPVWGKRTSSSMIHCMDSRQLRQRINRLWIVLNGEEGNGEKENIPTAWLTLTHSDLSSFFPAFQLHVAPTNPWLQKLAALLAEINAPWQDKPAPSGSIAPCTSRSAAKLPARLNCAGLCPVSQFHSTFKRVEILIWLSFTSTLSASK